MVRPLFQRGFPLAASSTYNRAGAVDTANTIPSTTSGASGETRFGDRHAGASVGRPPASTSVKATMLPAGASPFEANLGHAVGPPTTEAAIHRFPSRSSQVARPPPWPAAEYFAVTCSGVRWSGPPSDEVSSRYRRPSLPDTAASSWSLCLNTTGDALKSAPSVLSQSFG